MQRKRFSIARSVTVIIIALSAGAVLLMNLVGYYSGQELLAQAEDSAESAILMCVKGFDEQLNIITDALENEATEDINFKYLGESYSANSIYKYAEEVRSNLDAYLSYSNLSYYTLIFHSKDSKLHSSNKANLPSEDAATLYETLKQQMRYPNTIPLNCWYLLETETATYLMRMEHYKYAYMGVIVNLNDWTNLMDSQSYESAVMAWVNADGVVAESSPIDFYKEFSSNQSVIIQQKSSVVPLTLSCVISKHEVLGSAGRAQSMIVLFSIALIFIIPFIILALRRHLLAPLKMLNDKILNIRHGTPTIPIEAVPAKEAAEIFETFDELIGEIKELKIAQYEEEISAAKYQMQYLMLQLKPHFYLNFLKAIYALAEEKKYSEIQQMTKYMSEYFRYVIYNDSSTVSLREELSHVKNYVRIQQMGHAFRIECTTNIDSELLDYEVPTLSVQTFVENSVKYAKMEGNTLKIEIRINKMSDEEKEYLDILISDNGVGYSGEILQLFEEGKLKPHSGKHAGLHNLNNRLRLLYRDDAYLVLQNGRYGGALSEIIIPAELFEKGKNDEGIGG